MKGWMNLRGAGSESEGGREVGVGPFWKAVALAGSVKVHSLMECCVRAAASFCTLEMIVVVVVKEL